MAASTSAVKIGSRTDRVTTLVVLGAASIFFALSAYNAGLVALESRRKHGKDETRRRRKSQNSAKTSTTSDTRQTERPPPRPPSDSAVVGMTYVTTPEDCQATTVASSSGSRIRPKIHAGALFKLIDIAAGVAARRHARGPCLTISVDSVLLLKPIFLGDIVHVSASVNRAWSTSMEVGVRIVKETVTAEGRITEYVSHAYLTFVAVKVSGESARGKNAAKPLLAPVLATSRLESRRHMLAGRRRNKRLDNAKHGVSRDAVSVAVKEQVRQEVAEMLQERARCSPSRSNSDKQNQEHEQDTLLQLIEIEVAIQAWAQGEAGVSVRDGIVEITQDGDEPLRFSEDELRRRARALQIKLPGDDGYDLIEQHERGRATPRNDAATKNKATAQELGKKLAAASSGQLVSRQEPFDLDAQHTLTSTMHLVFPQHTNSHGVIFGGNTMSWSEDVAIMACRSLRIQKKGPSSGSALGTTWKTVAMDGLEFNVKVGVGELMIFTALVVRTFERSCEVYVMAHAESLEGKRRFTNDVLFTLACDDDDETGGSAGRTAPTRESPSSHMNAELPHDHIEGNRAKIVTTIKTAPGSALHTFAAAADTRRQQRLELRDMLVRVYGS